MNAFLVNGNLLTDKNKIREMWADHFESLGTPFDSSNFDNDFCHSVTTRVHDILKTCIEDPRELSTSLWNMKKLLMFVRD